MKTIRVTLCGALMLLLAACGALQLAQPQSFDQKVAYANGNLTAVVDTTTQALQGGRLTANEAKAVREVANQARTLLDTAQAATDVGVADQNLALAIALLENLQTYLNDRSKQ